VRRAPVLLLLVLALLVPVACGSDDDAEPAAGTEADAGGVDPASDDDALDAVTVSGSFGDAPTLEFPAPFTIEETARRVLSEGDGAEVEAGMTVSFEHVSVNGRDGTEFDNSFQTTPGSAVLDEAQVISGLVRGLVGVPVGSRVLVAMAPADAFAPAGGIPDVGVEPNDTILFVLDVLEAAFPLERAEGTEVEPLAGLPTVTLDDTGKPSIEVPGGEPPADLVAEPLIEGDGERVRAGQTLTVHYTGVIWPGGEQFDSSWDRGEPESFPIGVGQVIPGWDEGLVGRRVGSQVLLVIPPDQGYGEEGNPDAGISGTDTLVFVVDVLDAA
jgi:peptidylprolyl isomerase